MGQHSSRSICDTDAYLIGDHIRLLRVQFQTGIDVKKKSEPVGGGGVGTEKKKMKSPLQSPTNVIEEGFEFPQQGSSASMPSSPAPPSSRTNANPNSNVSNNHNYNKKKKNQQQQQQGIFASTSMPEAKQGGFTNAGDVFNEGGGGSSQGTGFTTTVDMSGETENSQSVVFVDEMVTRATEFIRIMKPVKNLMSVFEILTKNVPPPEFRTPTGLLLKPNSAAVASGGKSKGKVEGGTEESTNHWEGKSDISDNNSNGNGGTKLFGIGEKYRSVDGLEAKDLLGTPRGHLYGDFDCAVEEHIEVFPEFIPPKFWPTNQLIEGVYYFLKDDGIVIARIPVTFRKLRAGEGKLLSIVQGERNLRNESFQQAQSTTGMVIFDTAETIEFFESPECTKVISSVAANRPTRYIEATDGVLLSHREFMPTENLLPNGKPTAYMIHLHHVCVSNYAHNHLAEKLCEDYGVAVFNVDLRGHGKSGGKRGDSPTLTQMFEDLRTYVRHIRWKYGGPIIIGSTGAGCGLTLNYTSWKYSEPVDGYAFYSSNFGFENLVFRPGMKDKLFKMYGRKKKKGKMLMARITKGKVHGNATVIEIDDFISKRFKDHGLFRPNDFQFVSRLTSNLVSQVRCRNPDKILNKLNKPFAMFMGHEDEIFDPEQFKKLGNKNPNRICCESVKGWNHFRTFVNVHTVIGPFITKNFGKDKYPDPVPVECLWNHTPSIESIRSNEFFKKLMSDDLLDLIKMIEQTPSEPRVEPTYIEGRGGCKLCTYILHPSEGITPKALVIICGASVRWSKFVAHRITDSTEVTTVCMCLRGFGESDGERGDSPTPEYPLYDIRTVVRHYKRYNPNQPIFLLGMSRIGGVLTSYSFWDKKEPVDGYLYVSSFFGDMRKNAPNDHIYQVKPLSKQTLLEKLFNRSPKSHHNSLRVRKELIDAIRLIDPTYFGYVSSRMLDAITPVDWESKINSIKEPVCVIVGTEDINENCGKIFEEKVSVHESIKSANFLEGKGHFGAMLECPTLIKSWLTDIIRVISMPEKPTRLPELSIDKFEMKACVGSGAFAKVFLARHKGTDKYYALKRLRIKRMVLLNQVNHVMAERSILKSLDFPFICFLYGSFRDDRYLYLCTKFLVGGELFTLLRLMMHMPEYMAQFYVAEVMCTLEYLHSMGIVYRDLKPENILLNEMGHIIMCDFGFAKEIGNGKTHSFVGTPEYLSPEIIETQGYGKECDIWSLGIFTFELVTGKVPFKSAATAVLFDMIIQGDMKFPSYLSKQCIDFIKSLTTFNPRKRLGCGANGMEDVKRHPWISHIDWRRVPLCSVTPPYLPSYRNDHDTSNFISYDRLELRGSMFASLEGEGYSDDEEDYSPSSNSRKNSSVGNGPKMDGGVVIPPEFDDF
eukprot:Nk52_evm153s226 gene=Nk52_evmTU153s226